jgi:transposase InsO family protein
MPWNISEESEARWQFITERLAQGTDSNMAALCRRHGISRDCGYKWWRRFKAGGKAGLVTRRRVTAGALDLAERWRERLVQAKRRHRHFGPKKLHWQLRQDYPREQVPSVRTLARWLEQAGRVHRSRPKRLAGPAVLLPGRLLGRCCNDVWTADIKGRFRTADGRWLYPLTVRDQASGLVLQVWGLRAANEQLIGAALRRLFRRCGLPRAIRLDNGQPFGALGPRGWSRLNVEWLKLGIRLEHGRPGCPQDNAAHEQMHRVLKAEATRPPSLHLAAQQRRFDRWRRRYNHERPHERLGMRVPAACYRPSPRRWSAKPVPWVYPAHWQRFRTDAKGRWRWLGLNRHLGRALVGEELAARKLGPGILAIYLGPYLLGHLHAQDPGSFRLVRRHSPVRNGRG